MRHLERAVLQRNRFEPHWHWVSAQNKHSIAVQKIASISEVTYCKIISASFFGWWNFGITGAQLWHWPHFVKSVGVPKGWRGAGRTAESVHCVLWTKFCLALSWCWWMYHICWKRAEGSGENEVTDECLFSFCHVCSFQPFAGRDLQCLQLHWAWLFTALQVTDSLKTMDLFLFASLFFDGIAHVLFIKVIFCTESGVWKECSRLMHLIFYAWISFVSLGLVFDASLSAVMLSSCCLLLNA